MFERVLHPRDLRVERREHRVAKRILIGDDLFESLESGHRIDQELGKTFDIVPTRLGEPQTYAATREHILLAGDEGPLAFHLDLLEQGLRLGDLLVSLHDLLGGEPVVVDGRHRGIRGRGRTAVLRRSNAGHDGRDQVALGFALAVGLVGARVAEQAREQARCCSPRGAARAALARCRSPGTADNGVQRNVRGAAFLERSRRHQLADVRRALLLHVIDHHVPRELAARRAHVAARGGH